jgi:hypothetical protein
MNRGEPAPRVIFLHPLVNKLLDILVRILLRELELFNSTFDNIHVVADLRLVLVRVLLLALEAGTYLEFVEQVFE